MATTTISTTKIRMNSAALQVLRDEGWDSPEPFLAGTFEVERVDVDVVDVTVRTAACQSVDLVESVKHNLSRHDVVSPLDVIEHDESIVDDERVNDYNAMIRRQRAETQTAAEHDYDPDEDDDDDDVEYGSFEFATALGEIVEMYADENDDLDVSSVVSFDEAGLLTHDDGIVVRLSNGTEFQVTIVRSR